MYSRVLQLGTVVTVGMNFVIYNKRIIRLYLKEERGFSSYVLQSSGFYIRIFLCKEVIDALSKIFCAYLLTNNFSLQE